MTRADFLDSLQNDAPPSASVFLQAMWYEKKGNWQKAHELVQDLDDATASLVHAYLHRVEGDHGNAGYWYRRAGRAVPAQSTGDEWMSIINELTG